MQGKKFLILTSSVALLAAGIARADTIHLDLVGAPTATTGGFLYTYTVLESGGGSLSTGEPSAFTLFDVNGLDASSVKYTSATPVTLASGYGFSTSTSATTSGVTDSSGNTWASVGITDSKAYLNINGTYTGPSSPVSNVTLGTLSFVSSIGVVGDLQEGSYDIFRGGTKNSEYDTSGPSLGAFSTPLPSASLAGILLFGVIGANKVKGRLKVISA